MKSKSPWIKHGFWNTLEHALTRVSDAATSLVLLWVLPTETFSKLALAQAAAAPFLLLFISPEAVIYRDFAKWKAQGPSELAARLFAFRRFAWGKAQIAILLALLIAVIYPGSEGAGFRSDRFFSLIWAFALYLTPQVAGADREFLRLDLKLEDLNAITLFQKVSLLAGTVFASWFFPANLGALALVAVLSAAASALLARSRAVRVLKAFGASTRELSGKARGVSSVIQVLSESVRTFSIWSHLVGVILNWVQSMDLFFLGVYRFAARDVGLYAVALKLANFTVAFPLALSNLFSVWIGRQSAESGEGRTRKYLRKYSLLLFGIVLVQAWVLAALGPWIVQFFSHGRWTLEEQLSVVRWLRWILAGGVLLNSTYLVSSWIAMRRDIQELFWQVYLPWMALSIGIYSASVYWWGLNAAAAANVAVGAVHVVLLLMHFWHFPRFRRLK